MVMGVVWGGGWGDGKSTANNNCFLFRAKRLDYYSAFQAP